MKEISSTALLTLTIFVVMVGMGWIGYANYIAQKNVLGVANANADRRIFEQSNSYNRGMQQRFDNAEYEYKQDSPVQQAGLRSLIIHEFAGYNPNEFTPDEYQFYENLKGN